ncbi:olfactory receptor 11A1-like [Seriola lalandi dorsalis]|uniref:olfactory receptor 11A1-like n=1 Tax=Seriola lalandi dorsalis TaxID=1841481 RepID=UPI000C6F9E99|nr:olfactory receptor 11A1-like [Seriola lalandi dorsalis]
MENELNITYIMLGGFVDLNKYRYVYFLLMFTVYILIICSNSTIVCFIVIHQNLHEPMYIFIAALSLNSVLLSTAIYPKLFIDFLSEKQIISYTACLFQYFIYYSLGGSEFLLLTAMSYDRYVSICKPLQYPTIMRRKTISILLLLAWLIPALHVVVPVLLGREKKPCNFSLKGIFCNNSVLKFHCVSARVISVYGLVVLLNVALVPVLFILFTYTKILIILYRSSREVRKKAAQTCLPHLLVLISFSCLCAYDIIIVRLESDFPKIAHLIMTLQVVLYQPLFNPIIYGLKMKEIYKHLKSFFCQVKQG